MSASPALACTCEDPRTLTEFETRDQSRLLAVQAASIAEVERTGNPEERYRIVRPLLGPGVVGDELLIRPQAAAGFPPAPITSCDYGMEVGQRAIVVFMRAGVRWPDADRIAKSGVCGIFGALAVADLHRGAAAGPLRTAGQCWQYFVQVPENLERVLAAARSLGRPAR
ncbi:MAG TPA: hypothetical protein VD768_02860 [Sphingomicrobium sp.]|nr:hypothetical protein [Sphingomicrobium sp.]